MADTSRADLVAFLASLEPPECGCWTEQPCLCLEYQHNGKCLCPRFPFPCRHVLNCQHDLPILEWAGLLLACWPSAYRSRKPPTSPAYCLTHEARVALMVERHSHGFGLWHPKDLRYDPNALKDSGPLACHTNNGRMDDRGFSSHAAKETAHDRSDDHRTRRARSA